MEKQPIIVIRYWGNINRRAEMIVQNNKVSVRGFAIGYRNREIAGPVLEEIAEVPPELRKEVLAVLQHRRKERSTAYREFVDNIWQQARQMNDWFNY